jgi:hypothetical protein
VEFKLEKIELFGSYFLEKYFFSSQKKMKTVLVVFIICAATLLLLGIAIVLSVFLTRKPQKCNKKTGCANGSKCQQGKCLADEGQKCKRKEQCANNMGCIENQCTYTNFVRKNPRVVRFDNETRKEAASRRRSISLEEIEKPKKRLLPAVLTAVPQQDLRAARRSIKESKKKQSLVGVYTEDMSRILPLDAGMEIEDVTAAFGDQTIYLLKKTGSLVFEKSGDTRMVETTPHMDKIVGFGSRLFGVGSGIMHEYIETGPSSGIWNEINLPTRQILHVSTSADGRRMTVRDLDYAYDFDNALNVVADYSTRNVRFYGDTAEQYVDVDEETGKAQLSDGTELENTKISSAAFSSSRGVVAVDDEKRSKGIEKVVSVHDKIYYLARI